MQRIKPERERGMFKRRNTNGELRLIMILGSDGQARVTSQGEPDAASGIFFIQ